MSQQVGDLLAVWRAVLTGANPVEVLLARHSRREQARR